MKYQKKLQVMLLAAFAVTCLPIMALFGARVLSSTLNNTPYVVAYDEAYTLSADTSFLNKGYWGFRCKASQMSFCYGGTQTAIDLLTLIPFSKHWLFDGQMSDQGMEIRWPYLVEYPNVAKVLRWQRAAFVLIAGAALALWAWSLGSALTLCFALLLLTSYPFVYGWYENYRGIKSDFPGVLFTILQVAIAWRAIRSLKEKCPQTAFRNWILINLAGLGATSVRASSIPLWGASVLWFLGWLYFTNSNKTKTELFALFFRYLASAIFMVGAAYLILHPNTWISFEEAKWLYHYLLIGMHKLVPWISWKHNIIVLGQASRELIAIIVISIFAAKRVGFRTFFYNHGYLFISLLPQFRNALTLGNPSYYLTITATCLAGAVAVLKDEKRDNRTIIFFALIGLVWNFSFFATDLFPKIAEFQIRPASLSATEEIVLNSPHSDQPLYLVDRTARLPVVQKNESAFLFFDSVTDGPEFALKILEENPNLERVFISCWAQQGGVMSPMAELWASALKSKCPAGATLRWLAMRQIIGIMHGKPSTELARNEAIEVFRKKIAPPSLSYSSQLSVRTMKGTSTFGDSWADALFTSRSGTISGKYEMGYAGSIKRWSPGTTCLNPVKLNLKVFKNGMLESDHRIELSSQELVCAQHRIPCAISRKWASQYFETRRFHEIREIVSNFRKSDTLEFKIEFKKSVEDEACKIIFEDFQIEPIHTAHQLRGVSRNN